MTSPPTAPLPGPVLAHPRILQWLDLSAPGRVMLLTGRVELGQGVLTALSQIVADELDVDPARVDVCSGDTARTPDEGFTAGSLSIPVGGLAVRLAASAARALILAEAARLTQADPADLRVTDGAILRGDSDTGLSLWSLATAIPPEAEIATSAAPKPPEARRVVGQPLARRDLRERLVGAPFVHDLVLPGMLHGRAIHPPSWRGALICDAPEALRTRLMGLPGVAEVVLDGSFIGLVAAREYDAVRAAQKAAPLLHWQAAPAPDVDPLDHIRASDAPTEVVEAQGAFDQAKGSLHSLEVSRAYLAHGSIGPSCAVARFSPDGARLEVWTHSQGVFPLGRALAKALGLDVAAIHLRHLPGAGCYGHNGADDVALDAALMARAVPGRPVRVVWSREDEFRLSPLAPGMVTRAEARVDTDGTITAMRVHAAGQTHFNRPGRAGMAQLRAAFYRADPDPVPPVGDVAAAAGGGADRNARPIYAIPTLEISKKIVDDLPWRTSAMRALGAGVNVHAIEALIDDIAAARGQDPLALRLHNLRDDRAREVLMTVARMADWQGRGAGAVGSGIGRGIGLARYKNIAAWCAVIAEVEVEEEVRLTRVWSAVDAGEVINPDGLRNQIEGGIVQAASWTLKEAMPLEGDHAAAATWEEYPILKFADIPRIEVALIDRPDCPPLGAAEAPQGPTVAAIGNALCTALGVRIGAAPFTRDRLMAALA